MTCKIVVNTDSGNCRKLNLAKLVSLVGAEGVSVEYVNGANNSWHCNGYDKIVVCGGDGTLNRALQLNSSAQTFFVPCGTLNESRFCGSKICSVGYANQFPFGYVCATGSFTEIGYSASVQSKQKFRRLAYLPQVFANYRSHCFHAAVNVDGRKLNGDFTLLMAIKSKRCFGFNFNKIDGAAERLCLLGIYSCGTDFFLSRVKMFFPFFRVFFCGVRRPTVDKGWFMLPVDDFATICLDEERDFCFDGDKRSLGGNIRFSLRKLANPVQILPPPF